MTMQENYYINSDHASTNNKAAATKTFARTLNLSTVIIGVMQQLGFAAQSRIDVDAFLALPHKLEVVAWVRLNMNGGPLGKLLEHVRGGVEHTIQRTRLHDHAALLAVEPILVEPDVLLVLRATQLAVGATLVQQRLAGLGRRHAPVAAVLVEQVVGQVDLQRVHLAQPLGLLVARAAALLVGARGGALQRQHAAQQQQA